MVAPKAAWDALEFVIPRGGSKRESIDFSKHKNLDPR